VCSSIKRTLSNALARVSRRPALAIGTKSKAEASSKQYRRDDAYLLRHIIHDWNDDDSLRILRSIRTAIPPTGRLLLIEMVIPEGNEPSIAKNFDMVMIPNPVTMT
jgi:hypothetical protein